MSVGHKHSRPVQQKRMQELHLLMQQPWFQQATMQYDQLDLLHDIPYVGGSKIDWRTICFDRQFTQAVHAGQFKVGGRAVNPLHTATVHETVEGVILHFWEQTRALLHWSETGRRYNEAHDIADVAERYSVEHLGVNWDQYQAAWKPFIRLDEHEQITNPPQGLLLDPYQGDNKMMAILEQAGGKTSEQMSNVLR